MFKRLRKTGAAVGVFLTLSLVSFVPAWSWSTQEFESILNEAEKGNADAQFKLGLGYFEGVEVKQDKNKAVKWLRKAADQGSSWAQFMLGYVYYYGETVEINRVKAVEWFQKAVDQGNPLAALHLGNSYELGEGVKKSSTQAHAHMLFAAENGLASAQYVVGGYYKTGFGVEQSYDEALKWWSLAADQDERRALYELGRLYVKGLGVNRNFEKAVEFLVLASQLGEANAQNLLGNAFCYGVGVKKSREQAEKWFNESAKNNNYFGKLNLANLRKGNCQSSKNPKEDFALYKDAADQGHPQAMTAVAKAYISGEGVDQNFDEAINWLKKAELKGDAEAKEILLILNLNKEAEINLESFGNYYALIIGNNDYEILPKLASAIFDAEIVDETLRTQFDFKTVLIKNASRTKILDALYDYREKLTKDDNLLIYYAGHGYLDKDINKGYWLPIGSHTERKSNWISNSDVIDELRGMKAKHVMLVSDSCFSGTLLRGLKFSANTDDEDNNWIEKMRQIPGRTVMTSGNLEPVSDVGTDGHSVFAYYFLKELKAIKEPTTGDQLFSKIKHKVQLNAFQEPIYQQLKNVGGEGGDFIFVKNIK